MMRNRFYVMEHILSNNTSKRTTGANVIKEYSKQDKDLRLLSYRILLEKFNSKYGKLNNKQKSLLKEYINNISNSSTIKKYIVSEINKISKALNLLTNRVTNNVVKIKLKEVNQQLNLIKEDSKIKDKHLISLLRSYSLIQELANVTK